MRWTVFLFLALLAVSAAGLIPLASADTGTCQGAESVPQGTSRSADHVSGTPPSHWYSFNAGSSSLITMTPATGIDADLYGYTSCSSSTNLCTNQTATTGAAGKETCTLSGTVVLQVISWYPNAAYAIQFGTAASHVAETCASADTLNQGDAKTGEPITGGNPPSHWYTLDAGSGASITMTPRSDVDVDMHAFTSCSSTSDLCTGQSPNVGAAETCTISGIVKVQMLSWWTSPTYSVTVSGASPVDTSTCPGEAVSVGQTKTNQGVSTSTHEHWYSINAKSVMTMTPATGIDVDMYAYPACGSSTEYCSASRTSATGTAEICTIPNAGMVRMVSFYTGASYTAAFAQPQTNPPPHLNPPLANPRSATVVFVHGIVQPLGGDATASGFDVRSYFGSTIDVLDSSGAGWQNKEIVGYYNCDKATAGTTYKYIDVSTFGKTGSPAWPNPLPGVSPDVHDFQQGTTDEATNHGAAITASCTSPHNTYTSIEHLSYHWAWAMSNLHPNDCIDVVAHSMGGPLVRYALQQIQAKNPDYPSALCVANVITLSGVMNGADGANSCFALVIPNNRPTPTECQEMATVGSYPKIADAMRPNQHPSGTGVTTDWTVVGSDGDSIVTPSQATSNIAATRTFVFNEDIGHVHYFDYPNSPPTTGSHAAPKAGSLELSAHVTRTDLRNPFGASAEVAAWPGLLVDQSLAFTNWGCGPDATNARPVYAGEIVTGDPPPTVSACQYKVHLFPSASEHYVVQFSGVNARAVTVAPLRSGVPNMGESCQANAATYIECHIYPAQEGDWLLTVDDSIWVAHTPFSLRVAQMNN